MSVFHPSSAGSPAACARHSPRPARAALAGVGRARILLRTAPTPRPAQAAPRARNGGVPMKEDEVDRKAPRLLIVCENASARYGGEAALPLHYFRVLRKFGIPVWLVTHARTRPELEALFPGETTIRYVKDTLLNRVMWQVGRLVPPR